MTVEDDFVCCIGGNAEDIGDTWACSIEFSIEEEFKAGGTPVLGVGGMMPVADTTLPMNHD
jgi:hypothetical protein